MDVGCEFAEYVVKDSIQSVIIQQQVRYFELVSIISGRFQPFVGHKGP
jgi:hypothetical protein